MQAQEKQKNQQQVQIENPWCTYSHWADTLPEGFGKVVGEQGNAINILYSERQQYPPERWDSDYVKRFPTLEDAIKYFIEHKPAYDVRDSPITESDIRRGARDRFPSEYLANKK